MNKKLILAQYIGFTSIGMVTCIIGALLPTIQNELGISLGQAGNLLSSSAVGMTLAVLIGGYLADRVNKKNFLLSGGLLLVIGLTGSMFSNGFNLLFFFNLITGAGTGVYEIGINSLCADTNSVNKGKAMNYLHFFFGFGAVIGPILATLSINVFRMWRLTFGALAIFPVMASLLFLPQPIPKSPGAAAKKGGARNVYRELFLWLSGISILLYVSIEVSVYGWISTYWNNQFPNDIIPASLVALIFWLALTVGRLICGKIIDKIGFSKFLISAGIITVLATLIWCFFPNRVITLFINFVIGLMVAGIYPTILASATSVYPNDSGKVTALITIFASLGALFTPMILGRVADYFQITALPFAILIITVLFSICAFVTWNIVLKQKTAESVEPAEASNF